MAYAGKFEESELSEYIKPAYDNFDDLSYNISNAKKIIKDFIVSYCKTQRYSNPPNDFNMYKMSLFNNALEVTIKGNKRITYLINCTTGDVYVAEHVPNSSFYMVMVDFDFLLMMYRNSASRLSTTLLSPKL